MAVAAYSDTTYVISLYNQLEPEYKKNIVDLMQGLVQVKKSEKQVDHAELMKIVSDSEKEFPGEEYKPAPGGVKLGRGKGKKKCPEDFHTNDEELALLCFRYMEQI